MSKEKRHFLLPLKGRPRPTRHLLLYCDADETQPRLKCRWNRAWDLILTGKHVNARNAGAWQGKDGLDRMLDHCTQGKGELTVWLWRGWEDLILTGLAELLDCQACKWRYALLDGQRVLIRGSWRGKSVVITSIANWVGQWRTLVKKVTGDEEVRRCLTAIDAEAPGDVAAVSGAERDFVGTFLAIACACATLGCTSVKPSVASAAMQVWRRWLGPRQTVKMSVPRNRTKRATTRDFTFVVPSPYRPEKSRVAERHSAYGLFVKQLRRGLVDEKVLCVDVQSAYLLALCTTPIPVQYSKTLHNPPLQELTQALTENTGHALVYLDAQGHAYPLRRGRQTLLASGRFWTWLAGAELGIAVASGHVKQCHTAYLWRSASMDSQTASDVLSLSSMLKRRQCHAIAAAWRLVYSSLVGRFAGRRKEWRDVPPRPGIASWSEWTRADRKTGEIRHCRSIAGHQQELCARDDTSDAVPLLFGCVTAALRVMLYEMFLTAGAENVVFLNADCLWITKKGFEKFHTALTAHGASAEFLVVKASYDRVWMTGKSLLVTEKNGVLGLKAPGCPDGAVLDEQGKCGGLRAVPWSMCDSVEAAKGAKRRRVCFSGSRVLRDNNFPAEAIPLGEQIDEPLLREELLLPVKTERTVADE